MTNLDLFYLCKASRLNMTVNIALTHSQLAYATLAARALGLTLQEAYQVTLITLKPTPANE